jgi:UTP--glucose-1-phosphate uridylyltransferase
VSDDKVSSYWIIEVKDSNNKLHTVNKFLEKPKASETTSRLGVIGKYVLSPDIFDYLEKAPAGKDWEIRLADAFELMRQEKDIYGLEIEWTRYDTGDKLGFLKASIDFALKRDDLWEDLKEFLKAKSL